MREQVLEITYESNLFNQSSPNIPFINDWIFKEFTKRKLVLEINFTNPLYVSSDSSDSFSVKFTNNSYFIRQNDTKQLVTNYTTEEFLVPT